ncbi:hypothetical protein [Streptomyces sp. 35G-GA-8]|uniref:hypothetical protein n=1 Tax=Streptomyces sp. 35G-GA-8 TaxID=2939434 RepID=UPI00201E9F81|nr:hypothetical protein [Streptomyces sp. 35G-GA-8]MCL7375937.1 hypothetical protein [Streptomyces sp. 35G-GA-8]
MGEGLSRVTPSVRPGVDQGEINVLHRPADTKTISESFSVLDGRVRLYTGEDRPD